MIADDRAAALAVRRRARADGDPRLVRPARARARRRVRRSLARAGGGARPHRRDPRRATACRATAGYWYALAFALGGARALRAHARVRAQHPAGSGDRHRLCRVGLARRARARPRAAGRRAHQAAPDRLDPHRHAAGSRRARGALRRHRRSCIACFGARSSRCRSIRSRPPRAAGGCSCGTSSSTARSRSSSRRRCASRACCSSSPISSFRRRSPGCSRVELRAPPAARVGARRRAHRRGPLRLVGVGPADRARRSSARSAPRWRSSGSCSRRAGAVTRADSRSSRSPRSRSSACCSSRFPRMDQPWLDALERIAPPVQTVFLTEYERATRSDTLRIDRARRSRARAAARARAGRALGPQGRWSRRKSSACGSTSPAAARSPPATQLVLRHLAASARSGSALRSALPLLLIGAAGLYVLALRKPRAT